MNNKKVVYTLTSNGWRGFYRSERERDKDYTSQDSCSYVYVSEEEYKQMKFEDD